MFLMSYCYRSARLSNVCIIAGFALKFVCSTGVVVGQFSVNCWCIEFVARRVMFRFICLKRLVSSLMMVIDRNM